MRGLILGLLSAALVGCGAPVPSAQGPASPNPTSTPSPTVTPSPSPLPTIAFTCYQDPGPPIVGSPSWLPSSYCPAQEVAVETAVAPLGHTIRSITIVQRSMPCGPFPSGVEFCALAVTRPWAFVAFADTNMVAALTTTLVPGGPMLAHQVAIQVPPAGWSIP